MCGKVRNPLPALGVPGVQLPTALGGGSLQGNNNVAPGNAPAQEQRTANFNAMTAAAAATASAEDKARGSTILGLMGRGVLDTTILGQARRAPSPLGTTTTLGGS